MPAAPAASVDNTPAPVVTQDTPIDFDSLPYEQVLKYVQTGELPQSSAAEPTPEPASQPAAEPTPKGDEPAPLAAEPTPPAEPAAELPTFKFTENADPEVFQKEAGEYLETVEVTPELQTILDYQAKRIEELSAVAAQVPAAEPAALDETASRFVDALNQLTRFRQDPETQRFVPDTTKIVGVLEQDFPNELEHLVIDLNTRPSKRYPGLTTFQEFLMVQGDLDQQGMLNLQTLLENKGQLPTPTFVPQGIDPRVAEAYWQSPNRTAIDSAIAVYEQLQNDPMADPSEKIDAQRQLQGINQMLSQVQFGIEAQKQARLQTQKTQEHNQTVLQTSTEAAYVETTTQLARSFTEKLMPTLTMFDETGAGLTALAMTTLVERALTDDDYSKYAQEDLAKRGITFDWKRGRAKLDELYNVEFVLQQQQATAGVNPRSIELTKQEKARVLRELRALETELMGQITKKTVTGAAKALQQKVATAPKVAAVRAKSPKAATSSVDQSAADPYAGKSPEELQSILGQMRAQRRAQGLPT